MIKKLIIIYECKSCGSMINLERIIQIDEFLKKIDIIKPVKCLCGNKNKKNFEIKNLQLEDIGLTVLK